MPHARYRLSLACALSGALCVSVHAQDWPHWRGPHYNGAVEAEGLPKTFGVEENVRWAAVMPGPGASTPIVLGDRVFLSSVDAERERLVAMCLDRRTGDVVWRRDAGSGYKATEQWTRIARGARTRATFASPSPVSDGEKIFSVDKEGMVSVIAASRDFELLGQTDLGEVCRSAPAIAGGRMYVRTFGKLYAVKGS